MDTPPSSAVISSIRRVWPSTVTSRSAWICRGVLVPDVGDIGARIPRRGSRPASCPCRRRRTPAPRGCPPTSIQPGGMANRTPSMSRASHPSGAVTEAKGSAAAWAGARGPASACASAGAAMPISDPEIRVDAALGLIETRHRPACGIRSRLLFDRTEKLRKADATDFRPHIDLPPVGPKASSDWACGDAAKKTGHQQPPRQPEYLARLISVPPHHVLEPGDLPGNPSGPRIPLAARRRSARRGPAPPLPLARRHFGHALAHLLVCMSIKRVALAQVHPGTREASSAPGYRQYLSRRFRPPGHVGPAHEDAALHR